MRIKSPENCICVYYKNSGIRKGNVKRLIGKSYNSTYRSFRIGCPVHDKSLLTVQTEGSGDKE